MWFDKPVDVQNKDIADSVRDVTFLKDFITQQKAEIESLGESVRMQAEMLYDARTEAIKEFAERIEPKLANNTDISAVGYQSVIAIIDNLVKEMTEDNG